MIKESEWMAETMYTLRNLTEDEKIRLECEARDRYEHDRASLYGSGLREGLEQGREQGRLAEQANTERERQRAEAERQRAEAAETELAQLRALIAEKGLTPGQ